MINLKELRSYELDTPSVRYGLIRYRNKRTPGNQNVEDEHNLSKQPLPMGLPWDMMLYNPMLRGKKNMARGTNKRLFGCYSSFKRFNNCPMSMIYKDKHHLLFKILYGHA